MTYYGASFHVSHHCIFFYRCLRLVYRHLLYFTMSQAVDQVPLLQERAVHSEQDITTDIFSQHTLELIRAVCQIIPESEEATVSAAAISDLANKALQIISLRSHRNNQENGGAVSDTAHSLLRAAARCATRAREDTFRRSIWQVRQHVCVKAALESLFRLANQRSELDYNSMAQISGIDDDITDRMLIYANGLLVPHLSNGYSVLDFALSTGLDEVLQNQHVQCCIEALWHGDIVPIWPLFSNQSREKPAFFLERANEEPKSRVYSTNQIVSAGQRAIGFFEGLLRPERALAPIYFGMLSALGYVGYACLYIYLLFATDYRWGNWSLVELVIYGWSFLYTIEMAGKIRRQRLRYFHRVKHWCELMTHGMLMLSMVLRWWAMHTSSRERSYYYAQWASLSFSAVALPLSLRTLAAFDWSATGSGGLARVFRMIDRVAHEIAWTVFTTAIVLVGLAISITGMNGDTSLYTTLAHVIQGALFDSFQFLEIDALDPVLAPWFYRAVLILVWLILGNLIIAINVSVYQIHAQPSMQTIPRMERLAAGTLRSLCAPARHAFPVPWLLIVIVFVWPVENAIRLFYRIRYRTGAIALPETSSNDNDDNANATSVVIENNTIARRKHNSSNWRLAIWWMTLGWLTLLIDMLVRAAEWLHRDILLPPKPRW
ncbi:hypothetical protein BDF19DRAFT_445683 [Syncephalis fuscata]|nr:hypothetical protein BDF19DRAFT_445683 [Syncephalis fuscata]